MIATSRPSVSVNDPVLYIAFELSAKQWKLALTIGFGIAPWLRTLPAGDLPGVERVIAEARRRWQLPVSTAVVSCYEAGRDGFWIHRALVARGVANRVVDSASIEVNRRARRAKTDRIDAIKLVTMLVRVCCGEPGVWREVRVPSARDEAARHVSRERTALTQERTRIVNQARSWLTTYGCGWPKKREGQWWTTLRDWTGAPLPDPVQARLERADARLTLLTAQLEALTAVQDAARAAAALASPLVQLVRVKGVATTAASVKDWCGGSFGIAARSAVCLASRRRRIKAATGSMSRASVARAIGACKRSVCSWRGNGSAGSQAARSPCGFSDAMPGAALACVGLGLSRWRGA